jgi:tetratricopeptide (TPR) repeat protein
LRAANRRSRRLSLAGNGTAVRSNNSQAAPTTYMKQFLVALSLIATCTLSSGCSADEWTALRREVIVRNVLNDRSGAVDAAERLLNVADSRFADNRARALETLTLLSRAYRAQQAYGKEELARHRELRLWFSLRAPSPAADHSTAAEADQDIEQVRSHYTGMPVTHPTPLQLLSNMADQHSVNGRYERAESLLLKILALREESSGMDAAVASESRQLGEMYLLAGKPSEAEPRFRTAVERCRKVYGSDHFFVASSLLGLADAFAATGRADPAVDVLREALNIVQATYGAEHPQTAYYLDRLAAALDAASRRSEADTTRTNATAIRKRFRVAA